MNDTLRADASNAVSWFAWRRHRRDLGKCAGIAFFVAASAGLTSTAASQELIVIEDEVPDDALDHFFVPFVVPDGTVEIEIRHDDLSEENILDWGLVDQTGALRGWGGGNTEPAIVGVQAASRSYLAGPIEPGTWNVVVGKAKIAEQPASYSIEIELPGTVRAAEEDRLPLHASVTREVAVRETHRPGAAVCARQTIEGGKVGTNHVDRHRHTHASLRLWRRQGCGAIHGLPELVRPDGRLLSHPGTAQCAL